MKEKDSHIELIRRYFTGDASRIDQRSLDEVVKVDEYALDAKEGIDKMSKVNRKTSYANLETRLAKRVNKSDITVSLPWMKLAAGLAILVAAAFFVMRSFGDSSSTTAANMDSQAENTPIPTKSKSKREVKVIESVKEEASAAADKIQGNPFEKSGSNPVVDGIAVKPSTPSLAEAKKKVSTPIANANNAAQASQLSNVEGKDLSSAAMGVTEAEMDDIPATEQNTTGGFAGTAAKANSAKAKMQSGSRSIKGIILDESGKPLAGASISEGTNATTSQSNGTFELSVPSATKELSISLTGYQTKTQKVRATDQYEIYLNKGTIPSDLVVIGYNQNGGSNYSASPVDGFDALKKHISDNLKYPVLAKAANISGKVVLLFNVSPSGRPRDIEIKKSLGYGCDKEAIRLLVTSANWKPGTQSGKNRIAIKF